MYTRWHFLFSGECSTGRRVSACRRYRNIMEIYRRTPFTIPMRQAYDLFRNYVLKNPKIWMLSFSCMLIYMVRYGLGDWGITYLTEMKASSVGWASFKSSFLELMGIPGTILAGFIADRFFSRTKFNRCFFVSPRDGWHDIIDILHSKRIWNPGCHHLRLIRFFYLRCSNGHYRPGSLEYGAQACRTASAVGLTGAMSYFGAVISSFFSGWITDQLGWQSTFYFWVVCTIAAILFLLPLIIHGKKAAF